MCCSIRGAVYFLSSLHIYFAITQLVHILPRVVSDISEKTLVAILAVVFAFFFFSSAFMTFRGADEESTTLVGGGALLLGVILTERFTLMHFDLLLVPTLPEGDFLNPYGKTVPIIFTVLLYLVYLAILFCYHNELKHLDSQSRLDSPMNFHSPKHLRQSHHGGDGIP